MKTIKEHLAGNLYRFYTRTAELCGYNRGRIAGCDYVWNRNGSWPSYIMGVPEPGRIPEAVSAIGNGRAPAFWIMEKSGGGEIRLLEQAGVRVVRQWKGMILEGSNFLPVTPARELLIRTNNPDSMADWLDIVNTELMTGARIGDEFLFSIASCETFRWMVAYLDDQPAGAGLSFSEEGVCGIYMIATRTPFRGRGIGTQVTSRLIEDALECGVGHIVLHATGQGERIYGNIGFREVNMFTVLWHLGQ